MALLSVTAITKAGLDKSAALVAAASGGDSVVASSGIFVEVKNGDAAAKTVTVARPSATITTDNFGSAALSDIAITIPAGETRSFTVPPGYADSNTFAWTYSAITSVTVGVFSLA